MAWPVPLTVLPTGLLPTTPPTPWVVWVIVFPTVWVVLSTTLPTALPVSDTLWPRPPDREPVPPPEPEPEPGPPPPPELEPLPADPPEPRLPEPPEPPPPDRGDPGAGDPLGALPPPCRPKPWEMPRRPPVEPPRCVLLDPRPETAAPPAGELGAAAPAVPCRLCCVPTETFPTLPVTVLDVPAAWNATKARATSAAATTPQVTTTDPPRPWSQPRIVFRL